MYYWLTTSSIATDPPCPVSEHCPTTSTTFHRHSSETHVEPSVEDLSPTKLPDAACCCLEKNGPQTTSSRCLSHVKMIPQKAINSYPFDIANKLAATYTAPENQVARIPIHAVYEAGDFIVSFSGCKVYFSRYEQLLLPKLRLHICMYLEHTVLAD